MQQDRKTAFSAVAVGGRLREPAHQANAVTAVEDERTARGHHRGRAPFDRAPAEWQARQNRLDMAVRKPARRAEFGVQITQAGAKSSLDDADLDPIVGLRRSVPLPCVA